ncbi:MAG: DUF3307 domain-containing protein [Roseobacter sp.]
MQSTSALLLLLILFQVKHMFADFFLQTRIMLDGRETYIHLGRFLHAGVHAVGSGLALSFVGSSLMFVFSVMIFEWVAHFHIDWWKGRYTEDRKLTPDDAAFWRATGMDQALHQVTYVVMIWAWLCYGCI